VFNKSHHDLELIKGLRHDSRGASEFIQFLSIFMEDRDILGRLAETVDLLRDTFRGTQHCLQDVRIMFAGDY
jgi:hypothetical protein